MHLATRRGPSSKLGVRAVALLALVAVALAGAAGWLVFAKTRAVAAGTTRQAAGRPACAQAVMTDWADGRIDRTYPIRCYREAMKSLPTDLQIYSSAPDDIARALRNRIVQSANARRNQSP